MPLMLIMLRAICRFFDVDARLRVLRHDAAAAVYAIADVDADYAPASPPRHATAPCLMMFF